MFARIKLINISKQFRDNLIGLSLINFINVLFPLFLTPLLSQKIGLDGYGKFIFLQTLSVYIKTFIDFGFEPILIHQSIDKNKHRIREYNLNILLIKIIFFCIVLPIIIGIGISMHVDHHLLISFLLYCFCFIFNFSWIFIVNSDTKILSIGLIISKIIHLLGIILFVKSKDDFVLSIDIQTLSMFIGTFFPLIYMIKGNYFAFFKPHLTLILDFIKQGFWLFLPILMANLYSSINILILGYYYSELEIGTYGIAEKIITAIGSAINIINLANYPILSQNFNNNFKKFIKTFKKIEYFFFLIGVVTSVFIYFSSDYIIPLFVKENYSQSIEKVQILSFSLIFSSYGALYNQIFIFLSRKKVIAIVTLVNLLFSLAITLIISKYIGFVGFGYNYVISQFLIFILGFVLVRYFLGKNEISIRLN